MQRKNISRVSKGKRKEKEDVSLWHQSGREPLARARGSCQEQERTVSKEQAHSLEDSSNSAHVDLLHQLVDQLLAVKLLCTHIK